PRNLPHALDENQAAALQAVLAVEWGVLEAADGMRRSLVALAAAAERGVPTLVLVQSAARLQQWREDAVLMLGMEEADIGSAATLAARGHFLTVAPYAAIAGHAWPALELRFGFLILDEVRRVPLPVLREAVCALPARWLLALTDLPPRADGLDAMAALYVGPVAHRMGAREDMLLDVVLKTTSFHFETDAAAEPPPEDGPLFTLEPPGPTGPSRRRSAAPDRAREWNALLEALCQHEGRTRQIVRDVVAEARDGHACLVFTTRREHALLLAERIGEEVPVATLVGTMTPQQRREALRRFRDGEVLVLVAMEQLAAGGFEVPHLERVFLAFPLKEASLRQFMGRLTQPNPDRKTARLYDYLDENVGRLEFLARERRKYYKRVNTTQNPDTTQLRLPFDA
ncbi:MAG: hypothetical protein FJX76_08310, partial [Armatimonadetes bacterium]|nr:hypothetical protein [Armatimonadota bacterium]